MKRDVSASLILPHGLINRKQAGRMRGLLNYNYCSVVGRARVNWLLFSVVLQCLQPPNQCETDELCDPVYSIVLFIDFTSQHCWKTVLISSINVSFIIHIKRITFFFFLFYYVVIRIHADNLHLFFLLLFKAFIVFYEEKPNLSMKATRHSSNFPNTVKHLLHTVILHALIWHNHNVLHIDYGFKTMVADA